MAETTGIEWCDATVNFWWGCTKVSPGCDHCYAETLNAFRGNGVWGPGAERRVIKGAQALLNKLQRQSLDFYQEHGRRMRVFMSSMGDIFDNEVDEDTRERAYATAADATGLHIMMLTKRIGNVERFVPARWKSAGWPKHIGLMISVCTQREAERDIPKLLDLAKRLGIPWVGVSIEPMLEPILLRKLQLGKGVWLDAITGCHGREEKLRSWSAAAKPPRERPSLPEHLPGLDFVIVGGESGQNARPMHPAWVERVRDDCRFFAAFLFKQWGTYVPYSEQSRELRQQIINGKRFEKIELRRDPSPFATVQFDTMTMLKVGKDKSGRTLGGEEHINFPKELMA